MGSGDFTALQGAAGSSSADNTSHNNNNSSQRAKTKWEIVKAAVKKGALLNRAIINFQELSSAQKLQEQANEAVINAEYSDTHYEIVNVRDSFVAGPSTSSSTAYIDANKEYRLPIDILLNRLKVKARRFPNNTFSYEFFDDKQSTIRNDLKPKLVPVNASRVTTFGDIRIHLADSYEDYEKTQANQAATGSAINAAQSPPPYLIFSHNDELFHVNLDPALPSTKKFLQYCLVEYWLADLCLKNHIKHHIKYHEQHKEIFTAFKKYLDGFFTTVELTNKVKSLMNIDDNNLVVRAELKAIYERARKIKGMETSELLKGESGLDSVLDIAKVHHGWSELDKFEKQLNYRKVMIAMLVTVFFLEFGFFNNAPKIPYIEDELSPQVSHVLQMLLSTVAVFAHIYKWHNKIQTHQYHTYQNEITQGNAHGCLIIGDAEKEDLDEIYKEGKVVALQTAALGVLASLFFGIAPLGNETNDLKWQLPVGFSIAVLMGILNTGISHYAHKDRPMSHHAKVGALCGVAAAIAMIITYPIRKMEEGETFKFGVKDVHEFNLDPQLTVLRGLCLVFAFALYMTNRNEMHAKKTVEKTFLTRNMPSTNAYSTFRGISPI
ncbi:MAG: hypothetical protein ACHQAX_05000 [Gammaproteobacteria bacterium]